MEKTEYLVTRPTLASLLITNGFNGKKVANPFNPKLDGWVFTLSDEVQKLIADYYKNIGKPIPKVITKGGERG